MTDEQKKLSRMLVSHPKWEWQPGLRVTGEGWFEFATILEVYQGLPWEWVYRGNFRGPQSPCGDKWEYEGVWIDLADPAAAGVLLGMLGRPTSPLAAWFVEWQSGMELGTILALSLLEKWEESP